MKSDSAVVRIPELDFEIPAATQKSKITTVEGLLSEAASDLRLLQVAASTPASQDFTLSAAFFPPFTNPHFPIGFFSFPSLLEPSCFLRHFWFPPSKNLSDLNTCIITPTLAGGGFKDSFCLCIPF